MQIGFSELDEAFRRELAAWLADALTGEFAKLRGRGGPGDDAALVDERKAFERKLASGGWTCPGWPKEHGGRGLTLAQEVIFHEEYARARAPARVSHMGVTLFGPTCMAFGTREQQQRFLPPIVRGEEFWCQGYSEPGAGSDLANVQTRARLDGDEWVIDGQKVWTSWAAFSDWCFVLARTDADSKLHAGLSYLLVPMKQKGVTLRPIRQLTGDAEFYEVFYDGARTPRENVLGEVGDGWRVSRGTLAFERGASTLGQQMQFRNELEEIFALAKRNGRARDPVMRQRLAAAWMGLEIQRANALRTLSSEAKLNRAALANKLYWSEWHRALGELALDVLGPEGQIAEGFDGRFTRLQRLFLFTRAETLYGGTSEIQRNIIAERALGLPREARGEVATPA